MSNAFAIAAVTAMLRDLLDRGLAVAKTGGIVNASASVSAQPPDRVPVDQNAESRLNLFLYEIAPNTGWVNDKLPGRDSEGRPVSNPALALDLSYLLSAYGVDDLEAEALLGHGMQAFHENAGLSRGFIRKLLDPGPPDVQGGLPKTFRQQAVTLADQIELIKISPRYVKADEMSKIWTSLQAHYRPSMIYQATVVLIEKTRSVRSAPPVLTRGSEDCGPVVQANLLPPFPTLLAVNLPDAQPAVRSNGKIELFGHHLAGKNVVVRFENPRLNLQLIASGAALVIGAPDFTPAELKDDDTLRFADARIEVDLGQALPANGWAAGNYSVEVDVVRPGDTAARTTNALAVAIAPSFATTGPDKPVVVPGANNTVTITLTCSPTIQPRQTISLVLGDQELPGPSITAVTPTPTFNGTLPAAMFAQGSSHLARLRVDGVDSLYLILNPPPAPPAFDPTQRITMP